MKKEIGFGSFCTVYLVEEKQTKKKYAIKISSKITKDQHIQTIQEYLPFLDTINNPAILPLYFYSRYNFDMEKYLSIVIEYTPNGSLEQIFQSKEKGPPQAWTVTKKYINFIGIALAMKYLHQNEIIRAHLNPSNVLLDENFYPRISALSFSEIFEDETSENNENQMIDTLFLAPESLQNHEFYAGSDVYSFALIAYMLFTDKLPLIPDAKGKYEMVKKIICGKRPETSMIKDKDLVKFLTDCWSNEVSRRYPFDLIVDEILRGKYQAAFHEFNATEVLSYLHKFTAFDQSLNIKINPVLCFFENHSNHEKFSLLIFGYQTVNDVIQTIKYDKKYYFDINLFQAEKLIPKDDEHYFLDVVDTNNTIIVVCTGENHIKSTKSSPILPWKVKYELNNQKIAPKDQEFSKNMNRSRNFQHSSRNTSKSDINTESGDKNKIYKYNWMFHNSSKDDGEEHIYKFPQSFTIGDAIEEIEEEFQNKCIIRIGRINEKNSIIRVNADTNIYDNFYKNKTQLHVFKLNIKYEFATEGDECSLLFKINDNLSKISSRLYYSSSEKKLKFLKEKSKDEFKYKEQLSFYYKERTFTGENTFNDLDYNRYDEDKIIIKLSKKPKKISARQDSKEADSIENFDDEGTNQDVERTSPNKPLKEINNSTNLEEHNTNTSEDGINNNSDNPYSNENTYEIEQTQPFAFSTSNSDIKAESDNKNEKVEYKWRLSNDNNLRDEGKPCTFYFPRSFTVGDAIKQINDDSENKFKIRFLTKSDKKKMVKIDKNLNIYDNFYEKQTILYVFMTDIEYKFATEKSIYDFKYPFKINDKLSKISSWLTYDLSNNVLKFRERPSTKEFKYIDRLEFNYKNRTFTGEDTFESLNYNQQDKDKIFITLSAKTKEINPKKVTKETNINPSETETRTSPNKINPNRNLEEKNRRTIQKENNLNKNQRKTYIIQPDENINMEDDNTNTNTENMNSSKNEIQALKDEIEKLRSHPESVLLVDGLISVREISAGFFSRVFEVKIDKDKPLDMIQVGLSASKDIALNDVKLALKLLHKARKSVSDVRSFIGEYEKLMSLRHPNIVRAFGFSLGDATRPPSILLELCTSDVSREVRENKAGKTAIVRWIYEIAEAMRYVHSLCIVHRNLTPSNILIGIDGSVRLCDFKFAELVSKTKKHPASYFVAEEQMSLNKFMAPEMLREETCDEKVDVYSFGVVVYFMLSGGEMPRINVVDRGSGKKAEIPSSFTRPAMEMINMCWNFSPMARPSFVQILAYLESNDYRLLELDEGEVKEIRDFVKKRQSKY